MPKEKSNLELKKFLPALAALARGAAGGATRRGMVGNLGGGGGDNDSGPDVAEAPDSDLASNISDMNRTKMYKAEPDESEELVHEDVQTAKQRLKLLNIPADTAGQQAEDAGFNPNIPMPTPKFTGPNHPEGPGKRLINGFTVKEHNQMERDDKAGVSRSDYPQIQESLLKIMKANPRLKALTGVATMPIGANRPGEMESDYGDVTRGGVVGALASSHQGEGEERSASERADAVRGGPPTSPYPKEMTRVGTDEELAAMYADEQPKPRSDAGVARKTPEELADSKVRVKEATKLRMRAIRETQKKEREAQGLPSLRRGRPRKDVSNDIENSLLKIMKQPDRNDEIPRRSPLGPTHLTGPMMHPDDPTQVHNLPGAQASLAGGTMESQPGGGKITPVSRTQTMELPTQQEQEAWAAENAINYDSRGHLPPEEEAKLRMQGGAAWKPKFYQNSIENSLLKIMKVPSTPGTKPTEPGGISAATPNEASNPGGAAKLPLLPLQPQIQRKIEDAHRSIQSSIDKADYPSGLSDEEWKAVMEEKGKREQFGEVHQPKSDKGVYAEPHIQNSLLKLMKRVVPQGLKRGSPEFQAWYNAYDRDSDQKKERVEAGKRMDAHLEIPTMQHGGMEAHSARLIAQGKNPQAEYRNNPDAFMYGSGMRSGSRADQGIFERAGKAVPHVSGMGEVSVNGIATPSSHQYNQRVQENKHLWSNDPRAAQTGQTPTQTPTQTPIQAALLKLMKREDMHPGMPTPEQEEEFKDQTIARDRQRVLDNLKAGIPAREAGNQPRPGMGKFKSEEHEFENPLRSEWTGSGKSPDTVSGEQYAAGTELAGGFSPPPGTRGYDIGGPVIPSKAPKGDEGIQVDAGYKPSGEGMYPEQGTEFSRMPDEYRYLTGGTTGGRHGADPLGFKDPNKPTIEELKRRNLQNSLLKLMKVHEDTEREHDAVEQVRGISDFRQHVPTEERTGGFTMTDAERAAAARYRTGELTGPADDTGKATASREEALWGSTAPTPRHDLTPYAEEPTGGMARESTSPTAGERADTLREHGTPTATRAARMMAQRDKNPQRVQVHEPARGAIVASLLKLMKAPDAGMAASLRQARATKHEQGKAKTAGAVQGQEAASRSGVGEMRTAGQTAEQDAAKTTSLGADIVGQSIGTAAWMAGLGQQRPAGAPSGFVADPNTPADSGAATNPSTPPQGSVGDGSGTGMPPTPKPDTAPSNTGPQVVPQGRKLPPKSNPVAGALNRIQKP